MPSPAAEKYHALQIRADFLQKIAADKRIKPLTRDEAESYLHAALAAYVAAWEAYIENLVKGFYSITANPLDPHYSAIDTIARNRAEILLEKFNTPNAENTRQFLLENTGYDPWSDWNWPARNFNNLMTRERLNEILRVRHSFSQCLSGIIMMIDSGLYFLCCPSDVFDRGFGCGGRTIVLFMTGAVFAIPAM